MRMYKENSEKVCFLRGDNALVDYGIIHISDTGITNALTMIVRLVLPYTRRHLLS